ncbi:hypothetical protein AMS68_002126 [Peltaster fructicola]|uniref:Cutinase n=1 Tax=Peltaster fructicola TaxID=286661 RepID=A0A6H0XPR0_9PEZI|nr:hypothetical protein AMS68_002126 [Peltaster fructicola]
MLGQTVVSALIAGSALFADYASAKPLKSLKARDQTCYSGVYVIYARGTYEPQNYSLSDTVARAITALIPDSFAQQVQYPANTSAISFSLGQAAAIQQITDYYNACPCGKTVLMGYSQGAFVIGNAIANPNASISIPQSIGKNVVSVLQFGDPQRVLGQGDVGQGVGDTYQVCNVSSELHTIR